jgi:hypothetical protein
MPTGFGELQKDVLHSHGHQKTLESDSMPYCNFKSSTWPVLAADKASCAGKGAV